MIGPMPKFMGTEEWEKYEAHGYDIPYFNFRLKHGAPEWLKKAVKEYEKQIEQDIKDRGIIPILRKEDIED